MQSKRYDQSDLGNAHKAIASMVAPGSEVLEVGCATGYMTRHLKETLGCRVKAIELNPEQAKLAARYADKMIVGDVEQDETWNGLGQFDVVIFGDILEHLRDPWAVVRRIRQHLKPGGLVLASIPNAAYYWVRLRLLFGSFEYRDYGILDNTHLRFFTAASAKRLFTGSGFEIRSFTRIVGDRLPLRIMCAIMPNWFTYQFVIEAVPVD